MADSVKREIETLELDKFRQFVHEGIESGPSIDADLVFTHIIEKYAVTSDQESVSFHFFHI
jgi:antitoxin ParD1/3/4